MSKKPSRRLAEINEIAEDMWCSTVNWSPHRPAPRSFPKSRNISSVSPLVYILTLKMTGLSRWSCLRLLNH